MIIKNSRIYGIETKLTSAPPQVQYDQLIFTNISGETNQLTINPNGGLIVNGSYSLDEGATWTDISSNTRTQVNYTDKIYVKWSDFYNSGNGGKLFDCSKNYNISGDLYKNGYYYYHALFRMSTTLVDANGLRLNSDNCGKNCYSYMFNGCTSLTTAPSLPATTLANYCYEYMFYDCSSLTTAPTLPATTLANYCYSGMFSGCTSLTAAPALPATTMANYCYSGIFANCTSLTTAPALPATTMANSCYYGMFLNCTSLTSAPAILPATTLAQNCYDSMFAGCTALTATPVLPATTLAKSCYSAMFTGCTNLTSVTTYANDISASSCLYYWLNNVSATGDFYNLGTATYPSGVSGIPSGWIEHTSL